MDTIEKQIEVEAPLRQVYEQWTHFEQLPRFMDGVQSVTRTDDKHLHWVAEVGGHKKEWDAEIVEQVPQRKIAWQSTSGAVNSGAVNFQATDSEHTLITLRVNYEPEGMLERMGSSLGVLSRRIEGDLERFEERIQEHRSPDGSGSSKLTPNKTNLPPDYDTSGKSGV